MVSLKGCRKRELSPERLLTAVSLLCRLQSVLAERPLAAQWISAFADSSCVLWTFEAVHDSNLKEDSVYYVANHQLTNRVFTAFM